MKIHNKMFLLDYSDYESEYYEPLISFRKVLLDIFVILVIHYCINPYRAGAASYRDEIKGQRASIVRELHVYGTALSVSSRDPSKFQHQGYGTLLMEEAARISLEEHGRFVFFVCSISYLFFAFTSVSLIAVTKLSLFLELELADTIVNLDMN